MPALRSVCAFGKRKNDLAVDGQGLQHDIEAVAVLVGERGANIQPVVILAFAFDDRVRLVARLLCGCHRQAPFCGRVKDKTHVRANERECVIDRRDTVASDFLID